MTTTTTTTTTSSSSSSCCPTYYDIIASGYDELHRHEQRRKLKTIIEHLPSHAIEPSDLLLDVGNWVSALESQKKKNI
jgi:hypothetical protein